MKMIFWKSTCVVFNGEMTKCGCELINVIQCVRSNNLYLIRTYMNK